MATDLATIKNKVPAYLRGESKKMDTFLSGLGSGMPLPVLSFRGKVFRFRKNGQEVSTKAGSIDVIFLDARQGVSKRYYKDAYVSGELRTPDCASVDGITPSVANPVSESCTTCPNNVWGSVITAAGKNAKACQDYKRTVVLPFIGKTLPDEPVVLDIPATSMKTPKGYRGEELMFREYVQLLAKYDVPIDGAVTTISFTDAEYPQLSFQFARMLTEEEYRKAQKIAKIPEIAAVLAEPIEEDEGKINPDPEEIAPTPALVEETVPVPVKENKPKKVKKAKKVEEEEDITPAPVKKVEKEIVEDEEEEDDEALMAELKKILGD